MANVYKANPIKIDSAMGTPIATTDRSLPIYVQKVYWENPTTLAHTFVITDGGASPQTLLEGRCEVANQSQVFDFPTPMHWRRFQVSTLASGTLWIYLTA